VRAIPQGIGGVPDDAEDDLDAAHREARALRFSLAGVQLKFSAVRQHGKNAGLTIPVRGTGGDWIVKLPSARHEDVPENEFATMSLARSIGIDVPQIDLIALEAIEGLPAGLARYDQSAFAIRRFDRSPEGPVHIEDFAQVFGVLALGEEKYKGSYREILRVLAIETDETSVTEFVRRLTYSVLIGNGDMHLKNWSLIYPDQRNPTLAPAYDLLSTVAYIHDEDSALKFNKSREWSSFNYGELEIIAGKASLPARPVVATARDTVERFDEFTRGHGSHRKAPPHARDLACLPTAWPLRCLRPCPVVAPGVDGIRTFNCAGAPGWFRPNRRVPV
jgi:serine/threonine-protein kinase HipA